MSTNNETKINRLLQMIPTGVVLASSWLTQQGYSRDLQQRYIKGGWLSPIGRGAFIRKGDEVDVFGALYCIQTQLKKNMHIGGRSALGLQGLSHYVEIYQKEYILFAHRGTRVPQWFLNNVWNSKPQLIFTEILPPESGLIAYNTGSFPILISSPARALLECLYLAPARFDLLEAYQIMEGLASLQPKPVQDLLEQCSSVKTVRLFLFLAEKTAHPWFRHIDASKLKLGNGKRSIVENGIYVPKYKITIPSDIATL